MQKQIRVLKKGLLLGEQRNFGDILPEEEFRSLSARIQSTLFSSGTVEFADASELPANESEKLDRLEARIDRLESRLERIESNNEALKEPAKGDKVAFNDADGAVLEGVISSYNHRKKRALIWVGENKHDIHLTDIY